MSNTVDVYWTLSTSDKKYTETSLLLGDWEKVSSDLMSKDKKDFYHDCKSFQKLFKNTFFTRHPRNLELDFSDERIPFLEEEEKILNGLITLRKFKDHNKITFDYDYAWLFFSEEPVTIQVIPAFMHLTSDQQTGRLTSGVMDISSWYRPIFAAYQLLNNNKKVTFTKGEPMFYINFLTDKKVNLIRYKENAELTEIRNGCVNLKDNLPNQPLSELYRRFKGASTHKRVIKEIKKNLV